MEELTKIAKKQLMHQRITNILLAVLVGMMVIGGTTVLRQMNDMMAGVSQAADKVQELDMNSVNELIGDTQRMVTELSETIAETQSMMPDLKELLEGSEELLRGVQKFSAAVDSFTDRVSNMGSWFSGLFSR